MCTIGAGAPVAVNESESRFTRQLSAALVQASTTGLSPLVRVTGISVEPHVSQSAVVGSVWLVPLTEIVRTLPPPLA